MRKKQARELGLGWTEADDDDEGSRIIQWKESTDHRAEHVEAELLPEQLLSTVKKARNGYFTLIWSTATGLSFLMCPYGRVRTLVDTINWKDRTIRFRKVVASSEQDL